LADVEQELGPLGFNPGRRASQRRGNGSQYLIERRFRIQQLATVVDGVKALDLLACLKGARHGLEADYFVAEDAEVGEHEFRPGLAEVAKKHETQAIAQRGDPHLIDGVRCPRPPFVQRAAGRGQLAGEADNLGFAYASRDDRTACEAIPSGDGTVQVQDVH
jgi:hypothetical protein